MQRAAIILRQIRLVKHCGKRGAKVFLSGSQAGAAGIAARDGVRPGRRWRSRLPSLCAAGFAARGGVRPRTAPVAIEHPGDLHWLCPRAGRERRGLSNPGSRPLAAHLADAVPIAAVPGAEQP